MKILIDLTQIPLKKVGVGVYALNIVKKISELDGENNYQLIIQDDDIDFQAIQNVQKIVVRSKYFRNFFMRFLLEQVYIPYLILKNRVDLIHSLHYSFPLCVFKCKRVVTIHDLTFFIYPKMHTFTKRYYFRFFTMAATKWCKYLICVSESTANDLKYYFPRVASRVSVVPLAIEKKNNDILETEDNINEKYSLSDKYILFIGTLEPRKNIVRLIEAFARIENQMNFQLVIVGGKGWFYDTIFDIVDRLKIGHRIVFTGFVSEEEKFHILKKSTIFIYPSLYEGFGLPVLEALSMGIPTITSNISSMPEVADDAAILVDPKSIDGMASAMLDLLNDDNKRELLIKRGIRRSSLFSWERTVLETIEVYNMSLKGK